VGTTPIHGLPYPDLSDAPNVPSDFSALASAVDTLLAQYSDAADVQVFTSSGTWNKPTGARTVWVRVQAGGAGAGAVIGAAGSTAGASGGGGAGGYCESVYDAADLGSSESVTVGAGGVGGGSGAGGTGGDSVFDTMTATGGTSSAAVTATSGNTVGVGGAGGGATGGNVVNMSGGAGGYGRTLSAQNTFTNHGGDSVWGRGGVPSPGTGAAGLTGTGYGAGGGGAYASTTTRAGGAGTSGLVVVVTFF
jgi:hypothetical protein